MKALLITLELTLITYLITCFQSHAQSSHSKNDKWKEYIDNLSVSGASEEELETLYEDLSYLVENPFDLNQIKKEELERLPFLTDKQIAHILAYAGRYGKMYSVYELKNIDGLDYSTLELLIPFVHIVDTQVDKLPITVNNLLTYARNELAVRYDQGFQQKRGYEALSDSVLQDNPNKKYLGEAFYQSIRYAYSFDERIQLGFVAEKDAGEPFLNKYHQGYDYYSFNLLIKDWKSLKTFVAGDYKAAFGQGLVVSQDYSLSRSTILTQAERRNNGFRRHYSTNEFDFFRGVGVTLRMKGWDWSFFYSRRYLSGSTDSLTVTSLKMDGLHRLQRDWDKRNRVGMQSFGTNLRYTRTNFYVGLTALHYDFGERTYEPELKPYNLYYFRGKANTNMSVDYLFKKGGIKFFGETAVSANKAVATLNGLQIQPASYASFLLLYRNYSVRYQAFFANAFSQGSSAQNEEGVYLGMRWTPFPYWNCSAYLDVFRFPWLKYEVDAPSSGKEYSLQLEYNPGRLSSFSLRYRRKVSEKNVTAENTTYIGQVDQHRLRFQFYQTVKDWQFRTALDGVGYGKESSGWKKEWMIGQSAAYQPEKGKWRGDVFLAYFDTDHSSVTISSFERTPLYVYYRPTFYGQGLRWACSLRYDMSAAFDVVVKLASTRYFDREVIGTGLEEIDGSRKTDLNLVVRYKF